MGGECAAGGDPRAVAARERLEQAGEELLAATIAITEVPAPTFREGRRAELVARALAAAGLEQVAVDAVHNVTGVLPGAEGGPAVLLAAHLDTVFDLEEIKVRRDGDRLYAPGVRDNSAAVAALVVLARVLVAAGVRTRRPLIFAATAAEEGLGDLAGMRALVDRLQGRLGPVLCIDGPLGGIVHRAIGSRRLDVRLRAQGGHSWGDFGLPSAIHTLGKLIAATASLPVPSAPRTTFNVGKVHGGTSVNSIAAQAGMLVDLRSESRRELERLERRARRRWERLAGADRVELTLAVVGDRPAGALPADDGLVELLIKVQRSLGIVPKLRAGSTDANIPLSRGLPAVTIGITTGGHTHAPGEYLDIPPMVTGVLQVFEAALALAGLRADC